MSIAVPKEWFDTEELDPRISRTHKAPAVPSLAAMSGSSSCSLATIRSRLSERRLQHGGFDRPDLPVSTSPSVEGS
jgi:hypothetical protein